MITEFYRKHRPRTLKAIAGQDVAVSTIQKMIDRVEVPHALMLSGPSGTGKTTIARIIKDVLVCGDADYYEINSADFKGIDTIRDIRRQVNLSPISGECRIWMIDEAHKLTNDAQNALLKTLEETPRHVYFILATTDPRKLLPTIHTRCTEVKLVGLGQKALERVIQRVVDKETLQVSPDVIADIAEAADGSARKALVILGQVAHIEGDQAQLEAIKTTTFNKESAFDLARFLITNPRPTWPECAKLLRILKDEDPEGVRYTVLGYARSCMVGRDDKAPNMALGGRCFMVIEIFARNFYDSKQAGLAAACWEVIHSK